MWHKMHRNLSKTCLDASTRQYFSGLLDDVKRGTVHDDVAWKMEYVRNSDRTGGKLGIAPPEQLCKHRTTWMVMSHGVPI